MERQAQGIPGKPGGKLGKVEGVPGSLCGSSGPEQRVAAVEKDEAGMLTGKMRGERLQGFEPWLMESSNISGKSI